MFKIPSQFSVSLTPSFFMVALLGRTKNTIELGSRKVVILVFKASEERSFGKIRECVEEYARQSVNYPVLKDGASEVDFTPTARLIPSLYIFRAAL